LGKWKLLTCNTFYKFLIVTGIDEDEEGKTFAEFDGLFESTPGAIRIAGQAKEATTRTILRSRFSLARAASLGEFGSLARIEFPSRRPGH